MKRPGDVGARPTTWAEVYSNQLHSSAARWGLVVLPDWPIIDDHTDPYPDPAPVETLEWRNGWQHAKITLVMLSGQWSFCLDVAHWGEGIMFGPVRKFCDPYPTRWAALEAAIKEVRRLQPSPGLAAWLDDLMKPVQMGLF